MSEGLSDQWRKCGINSIKYRATSQAQAPQEASFVSGVACSYGYWHVSKDTHVHLILIEVFGGAGIMEAVVMKEIQ